MSSKPRAEFLLGFDRFSLIMVPLLSNSMEASHPCNTIISQGEKYIKIGKLPYVFKRYESLLSLRP